MDSYFCSGVSKEFKVATNLELILDDCKAIKWFENADSGEIDRLVDDWNRSNDLEFDLWLSVLSDSTFKIYPRNIEFTISYRGLVEIAKVLTDKKPQLLKNLIPIMVNEVDRFNFAKVFLQFGNLKDLVKNFNRFSIHDPTLLEEFCNLFVETRPDVFLKNIEAFNIKDASLKNALITNSLENLKYFTSGKIRNFVNNLLSSQTFDFSPPTFIGNIKQSSESLSIENQINSIFKQIAEIPVLLKFDWCGETNGVIQDAIFGVNNETDKIRLDLTITQENIEKVISIIKDNESKFEGVDSTHIKAYSINFGIEHVFAIIQFREIDGKIKYRLLQSWIGKYNLKEYMKQRENSFNQVEFNSFAEEFKHLLIDPKWTQKDKMFYKKYFIFPSYYKVDDVKCWTRGYPWEDKIGKLIFTHGDSDLNKIKI